MDSDAQDGVLDQSQTESEPYMHDQKPYQVDLVHPIQILPTTKPPCMQQYDRDRFDVL